MVSTPREYAWSSYECHAHGKVVKISTPHREYLSLGCTDKIRQRAYRSLFKAHVDDKMVQEIRTSLNRGLALGNERFKDEIERLVGLRVRPAKMGRPVSKKRRG
jgi:putative transposase